MTQTLHWVSLSINHARNLSENGKCSSYEEPNLCQNDIKEFQDLSFMYKYLQIANTYMYFLHIHIYNPYSNSFFILHALIHSSIHHIYIKLL